MRKEAVGKRYSLTSFVNGVESVAETKGPFVGFCSAPLNKLLVS